MHEGTPYIIRGCRLHDNRPPPGTVIQKSSFNHYATDQVVGPRPSGTSTLLADLAAQFSAGHPTTSDTAQFDAGPATAHSPSDALSIPLAAPGPAPLIPTVPNTPQTSPTRSASGRSRSLSRHLSEIDWAEVCASIIPCPDCDSDDEPPPTHDPLQFLGSPPPSPTESEIDWPTNSRANESGPLVDVDSDIDSDINPDDFDDFDYSRPPLCTPNSYQPSSDLQHTHWYDTADALAAEATAAIELHEARERVTETAAALVAAQAAADAATLAAYHAARDPSSDAGNVQSLGLDMAKAEAEAASKVLEAAAAIAAEARAQELALAVGLDVDDNPDVGNNSELDLETDEDGNYISTLPWASGGHWSIADQIRILGETYDEYMEH